jgi:hypothetical protein
LKIDSDTVLLEASFTHDVHVLEHSGTGDLKLPLNFMLISNAPSR